MADAMKAKAAAIQLARHYFETVWKRAGLQWGNDNDVEVADLVDRIIEAAKLEVVGNLEHRLEAIEERISLNSEHARNVAAVVQQMRENR